MPYDVVVSATAEQDLDEIIEYLLGVLKSPMAARRVLDEYASLLDALGQTPHAYPFVRDETLAQAGYQWASASAYMVFFSVNETLHEVAIERIAHQTRNWHILIR